MKNYYKIMLGPKSKYADECFSQGFMGADQGIQIDLSNYLFDDLRDFNDKLIPVYLNANPSKNKIAANLSCTSLWSIAKEINKGDIILSPNGRGVLHFGEVTSEYFYKEGEFLPHRRSVNWFPVTIRRAEVSEDMKSSIKSQGAPSILITQHAAEIDHYISGDKSSIFSPTDSIIEDSTVFALEKHLEDFLVQNWNQTELGKQYDIYEVDGEIVGQQYRTDTGPIDILAVSKDKKELLVVELKKGRVSDSVVGQIQRYMGYVQEELAEDQVVKGIIIALEDDLKIKRALSVTTNIEFYRYQVSFKLFKGSLF